MIRRIVGARQGPACAVQRRYGSALGCLLLDVMADVHSHVADELEVKDHPTIFSAATCTRKGLCPVTSIRHQSEPLESHSLYYEQHGDGPTKVLFIMG